jgi:hypothetical protein
MGGPPSGGGSAGRGRFCSFAAPPAEAGDGLTEPDPTKPCICCEACHDSSAIATDAVCREGTAIRKERLKQE